jgi:ATP synthase (C/AC39) subunit
MRRLLRDMPAGVPADCLLARIKGRRSFLVRDWERLLLASQPLATLSSAPWRRSQPGAKGWALRALQQEYFWAFSRMDEQVRCSTAPFFWLAEVRTLAVCLRLLAGGAADLDHLLKISLLGNTIRNMLRKADGCAAAVTGLAAILSGYDPGFAGLADIYRTGGCGVLEASLYEISLQSLGRIPVHPQMRRYCALLIDSRNLTTITKTLRWRLSTLPHLLEGGDLPLPRLVELFKRRDSAGLLHLAMRLGGEAPYSETADMERVLYEAQRRVMRRLAREADGIGVILAYLWCCGNEAANIGLLERLESAGIEHAGAELRR